MSVIARLCFVFGLFVSVIVGPANAAPLSGTKSVGPTGDYASLTAAIADIQGVVNGLSGALILELQPAYASAVETFPLTIPSLNGASATNTLTIRPASDATGLTITSTNTTAATVDLNGAQFVTIDGRPGGIGSIAGSGGGATSQLTIANTSTSGVALRFINEASNDVIRYTTLRGVETSASSGVVVFSTTTGTNGNDNNTVDHCDIRDGASPPRNCITSFGTTSTTGQNNSGNTISNCNIFNFHYSSGFGPSTAGVLLAGGSTDWIITGNSLYQTSIRTPAITSPISITNSSGNNFTVTGNSVGGSAPNTGGAPWTMAGHFTLGPFRGIVLNVDTTTPSNVHGNTVANISWDCGSSLAVDSGTVWTGILVVGGSVNIGTVTGNTIGNGTGTGAVSVTTSGDHGTSVGIKSSSTELSSIGTVNIANNRIGSITANSLDGTLSSSIIGILVNAGVNSISNNVVGGTTTANSLNAATSSTSTTGQQVTGILSTSPATTTVSGNTVANLNNNYVGTATTGQIRGIVTTGGVNTITRNTVRNLSTASRNTDFTASQSVFGISQTSAVPGQTVSQNTVHSLANTAATGFINLTGIFYTGPTSGTNIISRNLVHSLAVSSTQFPQVNGIYLDTGNFTAQNNMVSLGLQADGTSTAGAAVMAGIYDHGTTGARNFFDNSVSISGVQTLGPKGSFGILSSGTTNVRTFKNNIFVNTRSQNGGTGGHYAVLYSGSGLNPAGLTSDGNILSATGIGGVLGRYNNADLTTLSVWQAATGQDATSLNVDPLFLNPTGTAATVDLHIPSNSPANNAGVPVGVADDFDGDVRSTLAPTIGADELSLPAVAVEQTGPLTDGVSSVDFGVKVVGAANFSLPAFKITNTGTADLTDLAVTVDGANAGDFTVVTLSPFTSIAPGDSRTFNVLFLPSALETRNAALHIASNVLGAKNPFDIALTGTGATVLQNWRQTFYGTTGNTGTAANHADPYFTGVPNLAVFAVLGTNQDPAKVAHGFLPQPQRIGENYVISFTEPAGVSGVTYGAEWSATLQNDWQPIPDTGIAPQHIFSVPIGSNAPIYMRLRVTEQAP